MKRIQLISLLLGIQVSSNLGDQVDGGAHTIGSNRFPDWKSSLLIDQTPTWICLLNFYHILRFQRETERLLKSMCMCGALSNEWINTHTQRNRTWIKDEFQSIFLYIVLLLIKKIYTISIAFRLNEYSMFNPEHVQWTLYRWLLPHSLNRLHDHYVNLVICSKSSESSIDQNRRQILSHKWCNINLAKKKQYSPYETSLSLHKF